MRGLCLAWRHLVVGFLLAAPLHAQVVINELLAVNAVTALDEAGSSSDWIELVNIGDTVVNLGGYSLTDAPGESRKWVLPQLDLGPGEYLLVWCSGKDIRAAPPEAVVDGRVEFVPTLVAPDVPWRYLVGDAGAADPSFPLGWETGDFDDSGWEVGLPGFGFGEDDLGTVLPEGLNAFLLRHRFDVSDPSDFDELYLQAVYDDGFLAFLNGEEVLRVNVTDGEQDFASQALSSHPDGVVERFRVTDKLHLLQPGENVLAIAVINRTPGRGDMNMIPELGEPGPLLHTDFRLSSSGETVLLFDASGGLASRVDLPAQIRDRSYGRVDSNVAQYAYLLTPTPLAPNDTLSSEAPIPIRPLITPSSGEFNEDFEARITLAGFPFEGAELHYYTLDGTNPRPASTLYDSPLLIESDTIVRATVFIGDEAVSEPATRSYFRDAEEYDLPILSVAHDDFELLHIRGAMESPAHATFLSLSGRAIAATGVGMRIHGGAGRSGGFATKKSYRMYFRSEYGDAVLQHPAVLETPVAEFDKLVLRGGFNDAFRLSLRASLIRDQIIRDVHGDMGGISSHGGWYNLFVNMEYRGIYNVVERLDRQFLASYFPEEGEEWFVVNTGENVLDGGAEAEAAWNEMKAFFRSADLRDDAVFEEAARIVDLHDYTRYMIVNIWAQNHDWPQNNWYAARPARPDGKWIYMCWDAEWGMGLGLALAGVATGDTLAHINERGEWPIAFPFLNLLQRVQYQKYFIRELDAYLAGPLSAENVLARVIAAREMVAPDIPKEATLSAPSGQFAVETWESNADDVERFAVERPIYLRSILLASPLLSFARVVSVTPNDIAPDDEVEVRLDGRGFTTETRVLFNGIPSSNVRFESRDRIFAMLPFDLGVEGEPTVTVDDPASGAFNSERLLSVTFLRPELEGLEPDRGATRGGDLILVVGRGFTEGVRVDFGGIPASSVERVDRETLRVVTPPGTGEVDVLVTNTRPGDLAAQETLPFVYELIEPMFRRGDANADGKIDITDAIVVLRWIVGGTSGVSCGDAIDANDSGSVGIEDAIVILNYLFDAASPSPAPPFTDCGVDPSADSLDCAPTGPCA